eukprot:TRINITY_DN1020_c0_g5_i1.p1 TRINITY_DN1020_c0_g5~~TRINITY_DN1020_c0_g5_i1.p1  ORF type:complete len:544 (+),score=150.28 TRINITY_DN1020_c0_g5_i1:79-1710(+)
MNALNAMVKLIEKADAEDGDDGGAPAAEGAESPQAAAGSPSEAARHLPPPSPPPAAAAVFHHSVEGGGSNVRQSAELGTASPATPAASSCAVPGEPRPLPPPPPAPPPRRSSVAAASAGQQPQQGARRQSWDAQLAKPPAAVSAPATVVRELRLAEIPSAPTEAAAAERAALRARRLAAALSEEQAEVLRLRGLLGDAEALNSRFEQSFAANAAVARGAHARLLAKHAELVDALQAAAEGRRTHYAELSACAAALDGEEVASQRARLAQLREAAAQRSDEAESWLASAAEELRAERGESAPGDGGAANPLAEFAAHMQREMLSREAQLAELRRERDAAEAARRSAELALSEHTKDAETAIAQLARALAAAEHHQQQQQQAEAGEDDSAPAAAAELPHGVEAEVATARLQARCDRLHRELAERQRAWSALRDENAELRSRLEQAEERASAAAAAPRRALGESRFFQSLSERGGMALRVHSFAGRVDYLAMRLGMVLQRYALLRVMGVLYLLAVHGWAFAVLASGVHMLPHGHAAESVHDHIGHH